MLYEIITILILIIIAILLFLILRTKYVTLIQIEQIQTNVQVIKKIVDDNNRWNR